jgi:hypothetical protein
MDWWIDPDEYPPPIPKEAEEKLSWVQKFCNHNWKATELIVSIVFDCTKCDAKKEDVDEWENIK